MSNQNFRLNLLTPEKKIIVDQQITEITVPTQSGERQILPGHVPLVANLGTGILKYKIAGSDTQNTCVISWGYCEVNPEGVNILAEFVQNKDEVDLDLAKKEIDENKVKMASVMMDDEEFANTIASIAKAESAIRLLN